jgi:L-threonylcarbamoyladenylate synthase
MDWNDANLIKVLKEGGVAVMPTDTIYGIVGQALNKDVVLRIYNLKKRAPEKPCIILIGDISELEKLSIYLSLEQKEKLKGYWQISAMADICQERATSVVLDCEDEELLYLHRGTKTLAIRLPVSPSLRKLLLETGPLIAPSANPEGLPPAQNISQAKTYFSDSVNMYMNGGEIAGKPSKLIKLHKDGQIDILRD